MGQHSFAAKSTKNAKKNTSHSLKEVKNESPHAVRETIESIVIAVILAFLFRGFEAEAFVIPTGSMAPTLQGAHKDVVCSQCGYQYRSGASIEDRVGDDSMVVNTMCPICRYQMNLDLGVNPNHRSFTGDRILVSKFSFDFAEPRRWDIIVFKFPGNAKQNYIKRLVGLPNQTIRIQHGDIFYHENGEQAFNIARKPPHKELAMSQLVDDTLYLSKSLKKAGWPSRWQAWSPDLKEADMLWSGDEEQGFSFDGATDRESLLRYRHLIPTTKDWDDAENERMIDPENISRGRLIADFYAYNAFTTISGSDFHNGNFDPRKPIDDQDLFRDPIFGYSSSSPLGLHWVGDLAVESDIEVLSDSGELILDLVEGGVHFQCRIDVSSGQATLSAGGGEIEFVGADGSSVAEISGATRLQGAGSYSLRFSNVDDQLRLWINNKLVDFGGPTTYTPPPNVSPKWNYQDPGDLAPVGVGGKAAALRINRLRVFRDVYYQALNRHTNNYDYDQIFRDDDILELFETPEDWSTTELFASRRAVEFTMGKDDFFPMGDNSPQSSDGRMWSNSNGVHRRLLTGKAVFIYWPHPWPRPVPFTPNFPRMGLIR